MTDHAAKVKMKRLVGYFPAWAIHAKNYHVTDIPADQLTHIIYAFADVTPSGDCVSISAQDDAVNFPELLQLKQQHPQVMTLISVGGAKNSVNFSNAAIAAARQHFAQSCVQFMKQHGFDGIDIDWEFPANAQDKQDYTALLTELRHQLDTQGGADNRHYLLTIAAPPGPSHYNNLELNLIHQYLDWINLMAYDFYMSSSKVTNFDAPLYPPMDDKDPAPAPIRQAYNVDAAVKAYLAAGVPADKIVLGVHFVGSGWQGVPLVNNGLYQSNTGPAKGTGDPSNGPYSGNFTYKDLKKNYLSIYTRFWHEKALVPWLYNSSTKIMISYDDPQSLGLKANYVIMNQLGGVMIWELSDDDEQHSLVSTIASTFQQQSGTSGQLKYFCCDERRRKAVENLPGWNGIDFLEVVDSGGPSLSERQRTLRVTFINQPAPPNLVPANVAITGGERITGVHVDKPISYEGDVLVVHVNTSGDFSTYTLSLVKADGSGEPLDGLDPPLSAIDFSFKVDCHSDFDCLTKRTCPPEPQPQPEINYLAKDFASFRQLMLDRMALLMPQWKERNTADVGIVLVELLAYVGDYLSYQQDAIATEAYLSTARRRISIRRHARLVDYFMNEGCNARALVQVHVKNADIDITLPKGTQLLTHIDGQPVCIPSDSSLYEQALAQNFEVFETMHTAMLFQAHNELRFYTWGALGCCLPIGATRATLQGSYPNLKAGDLLIFTEVLDPQTGDAEDANPDHRHAVRLINVVLSQDMIGGKFLPNPNNDPVYVTEIQWAPEDALPFPLCISATTDKEHGEKYNDDVSIALGNIVLADHGLTIKDEDLGEVPEPTLFIVSPQAGDRCQEQPAMQVSPRFNPHFKEKPLTFAVPYSNELPEPANKIMHYTPQDALPAITSLISDLNGKTDNWTPRRDLLSSKQDATDFVVEIESDGTAYLRFGNYEPQTSSISSANVSQAHGLRPDPGTQFTAIYRIGNGVSGNVGPEAIAHIVCDNQNINCNNQNIDKVRNPLASQGGVEPESIENVRQSAPSAFRIQERAVTEDDYAEVAERYPGMQCAAATFRWTGSWRTVFVTTERLGGLPVDDNFKKVMQGYLDRYRMAGYDTEVDGPIYVSLQIEMHVCVKPDYFRGDVEEALLQVFSNRVLSDGRKGVFHPDNFAFGQTFYLSPLYAAAQAVEGVSSVQITTFQRQGTDSDEALKMGKLILGRLEIARLDNDPNFPEHGILSLIMEGGK